MLDGVTALSVPTKFGQNLVVKKIQETQLIWESHTHTGECWFEAIFDLSKLRLVNATFNSDKEGNAEFIAETLESILQEARKLNPDFLQSETGFVVETNLTFPRDWGLGTSSTLINNIAQWANINAYELLRNTFSGSGYDIASAQNDSPILYRLENQNPEVKHIDFNPIFKDQLYFVHLNKKQNSRDEIARYKKNKSGFKEDMNRISTISIELTGTKTLKEFEKLIEEHEQIISKMIQLQAVKERLFSDYFGAIKSLGAWGGDFILATGNSKTTNYFKDKGYITILPYSEMVL